MAESEEPCTDLGNARRLVTQHGQRLRYVAASKRWHIWNGKRWEHDELNRIMVLAKETITGLAARAEKEGRGDLKTHAQEFPIGRAIAGHDYFDRK